MGVVVLDTRLDDRLKELGFLRELLNRIQTARKEMGLEFVDRIEVKIGGSDRAKRIVRESDALIMSECLAVKISLLDQPDESAREVEVEGEKVLLSITKV